MHDHGHHRHEHPGPRQRGERDPRGQRGVDAAFRHVPPFEGQFGPRQRGRWSGGSSGFGRRRGRGDVRASVLALLKEQPMHGYQMITELSERSGGLWQPSPGSIYPILQQLQDEGLVRPDESEGRRIFHLTDEGRAYVEANGEQLREPWNVAGGGQAGAREMVGALGQVAVAARQVAHAGSESQLEQAYKVLTEARRRLYRILAEDDEPEGETSPAGNRSAADAGETESGS